ncbi:MAG TPA: thioredoxin-dependent thiol peroxidase [Bacteriovoracaceae bacterium]|nr:thioredoxin-dependent thiol peroxidase [Bacteriovoracaceae bacterium]
MKKTTPKKVAKKTSKKTAKKTAVKKVVAKKSVKKAAAKRPGTSLKRQSAAVIRSGIPQNGETAPEFTLQDQNGKPVSLSDFKGMNVVIYFYPKAMTPGCTTQACSLRDSDFQLRDQEIKVIGISTDPVGRLKKFDEKEKLNFTLLSDPDHKVAEAYGCWGLKKFLGREYMGLLRQSFLLDKKGKILSVFHKVDTKTHHKDVLELFKSLG